MPAIIAPAQTFGVAIVVHDMNGKAYSFGFGGHIPSAPQAGGMVSWDKTEKSLAIAGNWLSIALCSQASYSSNNSVSASDFWGEIAGAVQTALSDIGTAVADVSTLMALA